MLVAEGVHVRRRNFVLGPLDLSVAAGEYFVLLGPSGAGKTTLLEWLAGFHPSTGGELRIDDRVLTAASPRERGMGVVYQDAVLFPHLDVYENLAFPLRLRRHGPGAIDARVRELAALLRIEGRLRSAPGELSHGESRRAALGRALAAGCRVLLLDEPLQGLDPALRRDLRLELAMLQRQLGLTVVHITHELMEARTLATRLGVILGGSLEQVGSPAEVLEQPATAAVARYLMVTNYVEGVARDGGIELEGGILLPAPVPAALPEPDSAAGPASRREPGRVCARFEGGVLRAEPSAGGENAVPVWVRGIEVRDTGTFVVVGLSPAGSTDGQVFEIRADGGPSSPPEPGMRAWLDLSGARWRFS